MSQQPLSLSILGVEPIDEFIREVADFIQHMINTRPQEPGGLVEVEAKIGILKEKVSNQRMQLPILTETILHPEMNDVRFESNMTVAQHKHYNELLNSLQQQSDKPGHITSPMAYSHHYLVDTFYDSAHPRDREKIRVTRDERSGEVKDCVRKIRLGDLNIFSPKRAADWRISVNLEIPTNHPLGTASHSRRKDRLSYSHEEFIIDLTQVTSTHPTSGLTDITHELEVEIARPSLLVAAATKRNDPNSSEAERCAFDDLIHAFVNNARILARNASSGWS